MYSKGINFLGQKLSRSGWIDILFECVWPFCRVGALRVNSLNHVVKNCVIVGKVYFYLYSTFNLLRRFYTSICFIVRNKQRREKLKIGLEFTYYFPLNFQFGQILFKTTKLQNSKITSFCKPPIITFLDIHFQNNICGFLSEKLRIV